MSLEFFEALVISLMGLSLVWLSHVLGSRGVMRFPAAVSLAFSGVLAMVWQVPRLLPVPGNLRLPFEVVEVVFRDVGEFGSELAVRLSDQVRERGEEFVVGT